MVSLTWPYLEIITVLVVSILRVHGGGRGEGKGEVGEKITKTDYRCNFMCFFEWADNTGMAADSLSLGI